MARDHDYMRFGGKTLRCQSVVPESSPGMDWSRCKRAAGPGGLCPMHQHQRDKIDKPDLYVITRQFKPARRNADGSYRKTIYGKVFRSREDAQTFLHLRWNLLNRNQLYRTAKGRFSSAAVERVQDVVKKPVARW